METTIKGFLGIMEKKMETTIKGYIRISWVKGLCKL